MVKPGRRVGLQSGGTRASLEEQQRSEPGCGVSSCKVSTSKDLTNCGHLLESGSPKGVLGRRQTFKKWCLVGSL